MQLSTSIFVLLSILLESVLTLKIHPFQCALFPKDRCCRKLMVLECYDYCYQHLLQSCPHYVVLDSLTKPPRVFKQKLEVSTAENAFVIRNGEQPTVFMHSCLILVWVVFSQP